MTNFAKPVAQRPQNWLAQLRALSAANAAGGTEYTVEYPKREAGDTTPESERGVSVAITGNVETDHEGNTTGLTGWGQAVKNTGTGNWEKVGEDSGWITPTFTNSWGRDASYGSVGYRRIGKEVRLRGVLSIGTTAKSAFTLPAGFRPVQIELFTGTQSGGTEAILEIAPAGTVVVYIAGSPGFIGISGITFTID